MRYSFEDGAAVVLFLQENGFEKAELIGSLSKTGYSDKDIDILIPNGSLEDKVRLTEILMTGGIVEETDWGGIYFYDTKFGNVDIFFTTEDFDY